EGASRLEFPFREVGETFQLIDSPMTPVVIPRDDECVGLVEQARRRGPSLSLSRRLQPYVVQVYPHELMELSRQRAVEVVGKQYMVLRDLSLYDDDVGLSLGDSSETMQLLVF